MAMLIAGRALQGLGAGLTAVALYVVVASAYPESAIAQGVLAVPAAWVLPALVGPAVAGFLVTHPAGAGCSCPFRSSRWPRRSSAGDPARRLQPRAVGDRTVHHATPDVRKGAYATGRRPRPSACCRSAGHNPPLLAVPLTVAASRCWSGRAAAVAGRHLPEPPRAPDGDPAARAGGRRVHRGGGVPAAAAVQGAWPVPRQAGSVLTVGALGWSAGSALQGRISAGQSDDRRCCGWASRLLTPASWPVALTVWPAVPLLAVYPSWVVAGWVSVSPIRRCRS